MSQGPRLRRLLEAGLEDGSVVDAKGVRASGQFGEERLTLPFPVERVGDSGIVAVSRPDELRSVPFSDDGNEQRVMEAIRVFFEAAIDTQ